MLQRRPFLVGLAASTASAGSARADTLASPAWRSLLQVDAKRLPRVGACVHPRFGAEATIAAMRRLGSSHVRTDTPHSVETSAYHLQLARAGLNCCYIVSAYGGQADATAQLSGLSRLEQKYPGAVSAIEGPNEVNNGPQSWAGQTDPKTADMSQRGAARAAMTFIYEAVRADPTLKSKPVVGYTDTFPAPVVGVSDYANMHVYAHDEGPLDWWLRVDGLSKLKAANPGLPWYVTEWGDRLVGGKLQTVQAQNILQGLLTNAEIGTTAHYVYALFDDENPYGLFNSDQTARPAATNLADFLRRTGVSPQVSRPVLVEMQDRSGDVHGLQINGANQTLIFIWTSNQPPHPLTAQLRTSQDIQVQALRMSGAADLGAMALKKGAPTSITLDGRVGALTLS